MQVITVRINRVTDHIARIRTHGSQTPVALLSVARGQQEPRGQASRKIFQIPQKQECDKNKNKNANNKTGKKTRMQQDANKNETRFKQE